jgi:hypothetical protein
MPKILRIGRYLELLAELEKLPSLFLNTAILSNTEFDALLARADDPPPVEAKAADRAGLPVAEVGRPD